MELISVTSLHRNVRLRFGNVTITQFSVKNDWDHAGVTACFNFLNGNEFRERLHLKPPPGKVLYPGKERQVVPIRIFPGNRPASLKEDSLLEVMPRMLPRYFESLF